MSASDSFQRDQPPVGLSINLSSNNPFRNRAVSPASPFEDPPARPLSRNPFLDQSLPPVRSPGTMSNHSDSKSLSAEEIFNSLTLDDKKGEKKAESSSGNKQGDLLGLGLDISGSKPAPPTQQRHGSRPRPGGPGSPSRRPPPQQRRPRRNSESSVLDFDAKPLTEEEKQIIAARRRENQREGRGRPEGEARVGRDKRDDREKREGRERREPPRDGKPRSKTGGGSGRPSRRMDIIDQLDATSIYGHGVFHHDGPFDALNPHRNRQASRRAPMQAYAKDSLNNSLGGGGPLNKQADHSTFLGHGGKEAFSDYSYSSKDKDRNGYSSQPTSTTTPVFDPKARGEAIHGEESVGLGTTTFLEGTPAARSAIARHHKEQSEEISEGGLQRKKSLAQRIRGINRPQRDFAGARINTPEAQFNSRRSPEATSAGNETNPFFSEYGKGEEYFSVKARDDAMSPTSPASFPRRGSAGGPLERRATTDAQPEENTKPTGILGRMRSLKGGRRPKANEPLSPNAT